MHVGVSVSLWDEGYGSVYGHRFGVGVGVGGRAGNRRRSWGRGMGRGLGQQDRCAPLHRIEIDQCRLLTLHAAHMIDRHGAKASRKEIASIKVAAPRMAQAVIDRCQQMHGALGLSTDTPMALMFMWARALRLADGPDEVHLSAIGKAELKQQLSG